MPHDIDAASLLTTAEVVERARRLAQSAHAGQLDKAQKDYCESISSRVCRRVSYGGDADEQAVAWMHDVVEDTTATELDLIEAGFSDKPLLMGHLMTRRKAEDPLLYYARLGAYEPARLLELTPTWPQQRAGSPCPAG